jgi:hypothetical protein
LVVINVPCFPFESSTSAARKDDRVFSIVILYLKAPDLLPFMLKPAKRMVEGEEGFGP